MGTAAGAAAGVVAGVPAVAAAAGAQNPNWTEAELRDRRRVLALGFTEDEADAWLLIARAAASFFRLPEQHPSDLPDVVDAVHVVQRLLLQRPAYRRYRELAMEQEGTEATMPR